MGVRSAQALLDRNGYFAIVQARARAFAWDQIMQERANQRASEMLVGWIEEVHKGLAGLQHNDIGRLLNARYGLSWGLIRVMKVQRGIFTSGDNAFYDEMTHAMGQQSDWMRLLRIAFGIESEEGKAPTLGEQARAGLRSVCPDCRTARTSAANGGSTTDHAHDSTDTQSARHVIRGRWEIPHADKIAAMLGFEWREKDLMWLTIELVPRPCWYSNLRSEMLAQSGITCATSSTPHIISLLVPSQKISYDE